MAMASRSIMRRRVADLSSSSLCRRSNSTHEHPPLSSLLSTNQSQGKLSLFKLGLGYFKPQINSSSQLNTFFNLSTMSFTQRFYSSGKKILRGCFIGLGVSTSILYNPSNLAYAMHDSAAELVKDDFNMAWALARKYQLPIVMLMMLILGWRRPFITAINALIFLFCTRPNPFSIYLFIEHLRKREMQHDPSLRKTKLLYARKIEVEDYKLACYGQVELRNKKLHLIGLLGGWWIFHVSQI